MYLMTIFSVSPCHRPHIDSIDARMFQASGEFVGGAAGGHDIVEYSHMRRSEGLAHRECISHIGATLF